MSKPDVVISGPLNFEDAKVLFDLSKNTKLVMLIIDENRAAETATALSKEGYHNHSF